MQTPDVSEEMFTKQLDNVIRHITTGEISKGKSVGIHYFQTACHRIVEYIKPANAQGIWEARIAVRHPRTNAWVDKKKSSTLFPRHWTATALHSKLWEAYRNRSPGRGYKQTGITSCGIRIVFIFRQGQWVSAYPLYE